MNYLNELKKLEILHVDNYQYIEIKKLNKDELKTLCSEIREFLIDSVSETGGHLASNLGIVELTVAIHTVFNVPEDKMVKAMFVSAGVGAVIAENASIAGASGGCQAEIGFCECNGSGRTCIS